MFWGEPLAEIRSQIALVGGQAAAWGRRPRFSVSVRPILGRTEEDAWERAYGYLERVVALRSAANRGRLPTYRPEATGSRRLLSFADQADVHDKRLWTAIAAAVGGAGNTTALVGTPDQVAESIADYYDAGAGTVLIRGFEPLPDARDYGHDLIPAIRSEVARRDRERARSSLPA
jgi:alkanesulfonate monooxygenase